MCKKCSKIVGKNYRVEKLGSRQQACFACADEHGVKLTRMDDEESSVSSRSRNSSNASSSTFFFLLLQVETRELSDSD